MIRSVYVASAFTDYERTRAAQEALRNNGLEISYDWTVALEEYPLGDSSTDSVERRKAANVDMQGVIDADALLLLTPSNTTQGCGCWVELGIAMALGKRIVVTGKQRDRTIFCELAERYTYDELGVLRLIELARAS